MSEPRRSPERADLLAAVERVRETALANAAESERLRTLAPEVVKALSASGLFAMCAPRELGGVECDPLTQAEVFEAMTRIDTSAGWTLLIGSVTSAMAGAYLPSKGVQRMFSGPFPIVAGVLQAAGLARPTAGGYVVNGRWAFGSGVRHSGWVFTAVVDGREEGSASAGPPPMLTVAMPVEALRVEDTWDTTGLRGSGSDHYRAEDVFVPEELTCPFPVTEKQRGGAIFDLPLLALIAPAHAAFALGAARRALDEITALAPRRMKLWTPVAFVNDSSFQVNLGRAETKLAAARSFTFDVLGMMWDRACSGKPISMDDWALARVLIPHVTQQAVEVVDFAYRFAGAGALYSTSPLQRFFRDLHAAAQHIAASDEGYEFAASVRLGLAQPNPFLAPRPKRGPASD